ncbi:MAG TPA: amidohydrolase family protein [Candidatus Binataceae bacterium]|nr:amidohydrolase family protein [Candidatus Binataceae bacterium]
MSVDTLNQVDENNRWRLETPGHAGWKRTARPDDPNRYLLISADCHANEPTGLWLERMDKKYHNRLPRIETDENGVKWIIAEGMQRSRVIDHQMTGEEAIRNKAGFTPEQRIADHRRDGIDAEIMFPNKGLSVWATTDADFGAAQCRVWNDWAWELYGAYNDFMSPIAAIMTADVNMAIEEIKRVAKLGFRGINLPCKPIFGAHDARHPNYNMSIYDPMWEVIQDCDITMTFHISTGRDPRAARKDGGAIINYTAHALSPTVEPMACLCASGVLERFPKLRFAGIECGIGWIPWMLEAMDEAARKHHMWAYPKLKKLPSEYFREHGAASFQDDPVGLDVAEKYNLVDNYLWANDYPHHEGSWPHSAESIERQMGHLKDESRAKILGRNSAKMFKFDVEKLLRRRNTAVN